MAQHFVKFVLYLFVLESTTTTTSYNLGGRRGSGYHLRTLIGSPPQSFNVLVDTGSANFAIAGVPHSNIDKFFRRNLSSTYKNLHQDVTLGYTWARWSGELGRDFVSFPSVNFIPRIDTDMTTITGSKNFFLNGSDWQGILGLSYSTVSRPNSNVLSWIDSLQRKKLQQNVSFSLKLCGSKNLVDNELYGEFDILDDSENFSKDTFNAIVVREWFYEIVLTGICVNGIPLPIDCNNFNNDKAIIDSGTTNIHLPSDVFIEIVKLINIAILNHDKVNNDTYSNITKEFWLNQQELCWSTPQSWIGMPTIGIDMANGPDTFIRINLTASSYIRYSRQNEDDNYCYKFSIEPSNSGTMIGVVALEGFNVIFNRSSRMVGFIKSDCGPNVSVEGPFFACDTKYCDVINMCWGKNINSLNIFHMLINIISISLILICCIFIYLIIEWIIKKHFYRSNTFIPLVMSHQSLLNDES